LKSIAIILIDIITSKGKLYVMTVSFYLPGIFDIILGSILVLGIAIPLVFTPKKFFAVVKLLRPLRLIHYGGFAAGGAVIGAAVANKPLDIYLTLWSTVAAFIAFQGAVFLNDIFDSEIDRLAGKDTPFTKGVLSRTGSWILAAGLSAFSLIVVSRCGLESFLALLSAHIVSLVYSTPLLRAKKIYPLNVFLLAVAGLAVMVSGFASHADWTLFPIRMLVLILVTLTLTFGTKDMADVEGDKARGVRTLFTILGLERGLWVNAAFVLVSYLATPLILDYIPLFWAAAPAGVISAFLILLAKKRMKLSEGLVLLIYIAFALVILWLIVTSRLVFHVKHVVVS
jgi:4-hydroxybenzoate polyprenyltransferase